MMRSAQWIAALVVCVPLSSWARQTDEQLARLVCQLDADDVDARDAAMASLLRKGKDVISELEHALAEASSSEVRARLTEVLDRLRVAQSGGPMINGLQIELVADRKEIWPRKPITFKIILRNHTRRSLNVYVGYSTCGVYFSCGSAFEIVAPHQERGAEPREYEGSCGRGAVPLFTTVPPLGSKTFETTATYHPKTTAEQAAVEKGRPLTPEACYSFAGNDWLSITAPEGDVHRFRVRHSVLAKEHSLTTGFELVRFVGGGPSIPNADSWTGTILSNEVELRLLPTGPKMPTPGNVIRQVGSQRIDPRPAGARPGPHRTDRE